MKKNKIYKRLSFHEYQDFDSIIKILKGKNFCIDKTTCSISNENMIKAKFKIKLDIIKRRGPTKLKILDIDVSISMNLAQKEISLPEKNYDLDCVSDIGKRKYTCQARTISSRKYI